MHTPTFRKFAVALLLAACFHAPAAFAAGADCTEVTAVPAVLSQPGSYCLAGDFQIDSTTAKAITINADDVILDCRGHTLRNKATSASGKSEGVYAYGHHGIVVRNCSIQGGFTNGISVVQDNAGGTKSYYVTIEGNLVGGPLWHGIRAYGSALEIRDNRVYDVGGQSNSYAMGIRVAGSDSASAPHFHIVKDNVVAGTLSPAKQAYAIYSENSVASQFTGNNIVATEAPTASGHSYGMRIGGSMNTVRDNHIVGPPRDNDTGILARSSTTDCFDNHIRSPQPTSGCDASLGNY
ncbi:MAG TPA: right-handed parallel beta-helix repeat-containing protein [Luteimonas sp.]|jgi:hypothetical protein|nr:right-handed parallel beta-helix repeat-containing protein [Luteimonas sp.]